MVELTWSSCLLICSWQLACEIWWLQCQERLGLGTSLWARGDGVWLAVLHSRQADQRGFYCQLAKPPAQRLTNALPLALLQLAFTNSFLSLQIVNQYPVFFSEECASDIQGMDCKLRILSQNLSIHSRKLDCHTHVRKLTHFSPY